MIFANLLRSIECRIFTIKMRQPNSIKMATTRSITPTAVSLIVVPSKRKEHVCFSVMVVTLWVWSVPTPTRDTLMSSVLQFFIRDLPLPSVLPRAIFVMTFLSVWIMSFVSGSVTTLSSFRFVFLPSERWRPLMIIPVKRHKYPEKTPNGSNTSTDSQLKMSWTTAPAKARRNSFRSLTWANETMVLVTVVPTFAPITIGMAGFTGRTDKINNAIILIENGFDRASDTSTFMEFYHPGAVTIWKKWSLRSANPKMDHVSSKEQRTAAGQTGRMTTEFGQKQLSHYGNNWRVKSAYWSIRPAVLINGKHPRWGSPRDVGEHRNKGKTS